jgi:hypothetical protein
VPFAALAQSSSVVEVITNTNVSSSKNVTQTSVETRGNAEVRIRTVVNDSVVEDMFVEDGVVHDCANPSLPDALAACANLRAEAQTQIQTRETQAQIEHESSSTIEKQTENIPESAPEANEEWSLQSFLDHLQLLFFPSEEAASDLRTTGENAISSFFSSIREIITGFFNQFI